MSIRRTTDRHPTQLRAATAALAAAVLCLGVAPPPAAAVVEAPSPPPANWVRQAGGAGTTFPTAVATAADGSVAVVGSFEGSADFGSGLDTVTLTTADGNDTFLARYLSDGTLDWVVAIASAGFDSAGGVAVGADDSIVVTGSGPASVTFGSASSAPAMVLTHPDFGGGYVARYGPDGSPTWASNAGNLARPHEVAVGPGGEVTVAGTMPSATTTTFGTGDSAVTLAQRGGGDAFLARYRADGSLDWAVAAGGPNFDVANSVAVGADGAATITGLYSGLAAFGAGPDQVLLEDDFFGGSFTARYHADGTLAWVTSGGGGDDAGDAQGHAVAVRPDGAAVVTGGLGKRTGTATFGSGAAAVTLTSRGNEDVYLAQYSADGTLDWIRTAGGRFDDAPRDLALAPDGSVSITGTVSHSFSPGVTLDSDSGPVGLTTFGFLDAFLAAYDADGSLQLATAVGSSFRDFGQAVAVAPDGATVWAGSIADTGTFQTTAGEVVFTSRGTNVNSNMFLARYGATVVDQASPIVTITSPADGSAHLLNSSLIADYTCVDEAGGSGIASCVGTVADGGTVDTTTVGAGIFTVTGTDNAGNRNSATSGYDVVYGFSGYAAPIREGVNLITAGRKLALRFSVFDANGAPVTDIVEVRGTARRFACEAENPVDTIDEEVFGSPGLKSHGDGSYQYIFPTSRSWAGSCRTLGLDLGDGVVRGVDFEFR